MMILITSLLIRLSKRSSINEYFKGISNSMCIHPGKKRKHMNKCTMSRLNKLSSISKRVAHSQWTPILLRTHLS